MLNNEVERRRGSLMRASESGVVGKFGVVGNYGISSWQKSSEEMSAKVRC